MKGMSPAMWQHVYSMDDWDLQTMQAQDDPAEPVHTIYRLKNRMDGTVLPISSWEGDALRTQPEWRRRALFNALVSKVRGGGRVARWASIGGVAL